MRVPFFWSRRLLLATTSLLLTSCQQVTLPIDRSHTSLNQDSRIQSVIVHYTQIDDAQSLDELTRPASRVSAHYLLSREERDGQPIVYALVPESQRAWHAGVSHWQGAQALNASSIGIEIVNLGYADADAQLPLIERHWQAYTSGQIQTLALLLRQLVDRYQLPPTRLLGHSDIAPGRKVDPGPLFPWQQLHDHYGLGAWPDEARVSALLTMPGPVPSISEIQNLLIRYGYGLAATGTLDTRTRQTVQAFQLHFRPARYDGLPDRETVARLQALLEKYPSEN
ncbi:N-acetylmuramoyl-L-alanine amidase [Pseudaeromonas pectinilytica]